MCLILAFIVSCEQGSKGESARGMEEIMTVIRERGLAFAVGNSWNILI